MREEKGRRSQPQGERARVAQQPLLLILCRTTGRAEGRPPRAGAYLKYLSPENLPRFRRGHSPKSYDAAPMIITLKREKK
jgi:hypothetical protein